MKKLSILMAGLTCLTVGGVYATWTYAQNADVDSKTQVLGIAMADIADSGAYGTYEIIRSKTEGLITVDATSESNHTARLSYNGTITLKFTPSPSADETVKTQGVKSVYKFYTTVGQSNEQSAWVYQDKQIFDVNTTTVTIDVDTATEGAKWTEKQGEDGKVYFEYVITETMLESIISLKNTFVLDNKTEYEAFRTALGTGSITCYINDFATEK